MLDEREQTPSDRLALAVHYLIADKVVKTQAQIAEATGCATNWFSAMTRGAHPPSRGGREVKIPWEWAKEFEAQYGYRATWLMDGVQPMTVKAPPSIPPGGENPDALPPYWRPTPHCSWCNNPVKTQAVTCPKCGVRILWREDQARPA